MFTQSPNLSTFINQSAESIPPDFLSDTLLFKLIVESFFDGILILTDEGELIESNEFARQICTQLTPSQSPSNLVPQEIWLICQSLIKSYSFSPQQSDSIESEIITNRSMPLRIRVQWLKLNAIHRPCLLVILEDRSQSLHNLAISEVDKYGLTPRESDVWLLSRANYSRQEIAAELCISLNTVKKHLKNINAKRKMVFDLHDYSSQLI
jgi:DNA-binding CsgD family transcriptional regulator